VEATAPAAPVATAGMPFFFFFFFLNKDGSLSYQFFNYS
jgi:hypothetical protein